LKVKKDFGELFIYTLWASIFSALISVFLGLSDYILLFFIFTAFISFCCMAYFLVSDNRKAYSLKDIIIIIGWSAIIGFAIIIIVFISDIIITSLTNNIPDIIYGFLGLIVFIFLLTPFFRK